MRQAGFDYDPAQASPGLIIHIFGSLEPAAGSTISVSLEDYGTLKVLMSTGKLFTIKDIVKYVANKRGGVHYDPTTLNEGEESMKGVSNSFYFAHLDAILGQVNYIGQNIVNSAFRCGFIGV